MEARVFLFLTMAVTAVVSQGCDPYKGFPSHTMCIYKAKACPGFTLLRSGALSAADKAGVVDLHNKLRQSLVDGKVSGQPKAKSMTTLTWDDELATIAQRAADQCLFQHDKMRDVARFKVGQNIYSSSESAGGQNTPDFASAINDWFAENTNFPSSNINPYKFVSGTGHYTQLAWAETSKVGCGYVMYKSGSETTKNYHCNYGTSGNIIGQPMYITDGKDNTIINGGAGAATEPADIMYY